MSVINLNQVSKIYGFGESATKALDSVDIIIEKGEFVAIMGPSGSGKSTLMNIIGLLDRPSSGVYKLDERDVSRQGQRKQARVRREKIGFIFQSFNLLPKLSAIENVSLPLIYKGIGHVKRLDRAAKMLKNVGLEDRQYYMPNQLSGGQVQRVAVARALANHPSLVLADEPTGNLDSVSSTDVMELLKEVHTGGNTIVMITHNPELAEYAERIITMRDGKVESDVKINKKSAKKAAKKKPAAKKGKKPAKKTTKKKKVTKK